MIEKIKYLDAGFDAQVLVDAERPFDQWRDIVNRRAAAALRPITTPLITGRSVVAPVSPLLVTPVTMLYGSPEASVSPRRNAVPTGHPHPAEYEAVPLIKNRVWHSPSAGEIRVVGILAG